MRVVLMRHAEAARGPWSDADRPLTADGIAAAEAAARGLVRLEPQVARVLTSPALRARDTGDILAREWGVRAEVEDDLAIGGNRERAVARLRGSTSGATVVAVGHAPDLGVLAALLLGVAIELPFECCGGTCIEVAAAVDRAGVLAWAMGPEALAALGAG